MTVRLSVLAVVMVAALAGSRDTSVAAAGGSQAQPAPRPAPAATPASPAAQTAKPPAFFTSKLPPAELRNKQAVVETSSGRIVLDLLGDAAPNHVALFITRAREGAYDGTVFHRVIPMGIVQGGDPLSKDPGQSAKYGTGGLRQLRFEPNNEKHTRGAVSAVLVPNDRDSAGAQFFICVTDQPALDGQYTVFARVVEGFRVTEAISKVPNNGGVPADRAVIKSVTIRDRAPEAFSTESPAELSKMRVVFETTVGSMTIELFPDKAPNHVRQFLRLTAAGVYDGTAFHRIVPDFVIQGGHVPTRKEPLGDRQEELVRTLQPEFNDTAHELGVLSMAHGADPASASTSFFIVLDRAPSLDRQYTAFGKVVAGLDVVQKIGSVVLDGETPVRRLEITKATVMK
jgi:peptidyl-prolyl cis-trans isomerase B (cyclophilin B)